LHEEFSIKAAEAKKQYHLRKTPDWIFGKERKEEQVGFAVSKN